VTSAGAVTDDPRQLAGRAPGDNEFVIPTVRTRWRSPGCALQRLGVIIAAYPAFLNIVRGRDGVSRSASKSSRGWPTGMMRLGRPGHRRGAMSVEAVAIPNRLLPSQHRPRRSRSVTGRAFGPVRAIR